MIIEGVKGHIIMNPIGKIIAKLDPNWSYLKNIFSIRYYTTLWLDYITRKISKDLYIENIKIFKNYIEKRSSYIFSYYDI
jgi:hypothetical protein